MSRNGMIGVGNPDPFVLNGYMDTYQNKQYVVKRPGFTATGYPQLNSSCQGLFYYQGVYYYVGYNGGLGDILVCTSGTQNAGTNGTVFTQQTTIPAQPWYGRNGFGCVVFQNQIFVIGGYTPNQITSTTSDVYSTVDGKNWTQVTGAAPFPLRTAFGCVVFKNKIWVIGGVVPGSGPSFNDVWSSPDGNTWTQVTANAPWAARWGLAAVVGNGGIYIFGGVTAPGFANDVWFSTDGVTWSQLTAAAQQANGAAAWSGRFYHSAFFFLGSNIVVVGGQNGSGYLADSWYSRDGKVWTLAATGLFGGNGRSQMAPVIYNGNMWLIGGLTPSGASSQIYMCPNTAGSVWTLVTSFPGFAARFGGGAVSFPSPPNLQTGASTPYSRLQFQTIWVMGGTNSVLYYADVWYGNINVPIILEQQLNPITGMLAYNFASFNNGSQLLIQNPTNLSVLTGGTLVQVSDPNYPQFTVPGVVVLNNIAYVMSQNKTIYGSATSDATTWPALQFLQAEYEDDPGVCMAKYLNYIVVFGSYTMQFLYDAGNAAPGISLSPYLGANQRYGCLNAGTVQTINNTLYWVGQDQNGDLGVFMLNGFSPQRVSVPWVDTVIQLFFYASESTVIIGRIDSQVVEAYGHKFYILPIISQPYALVLDVTTNQWMLWQIGQTGQWPFSFSATNLDLNLTVLGCNYTQNGQIWEWLNSSPFTWQDNGIPFTCAVQTDKIDDGTSARKFYQYLDFVSDSNINLNSTCSVSISYSDNDYVSFSTPRNLVLNNPAAPTQRPRLARLGCSYRRAWYITQTDNNPARWEAIEVTYETDDGS